MPLPRIGAVGLVFIAIAMTLGLAGCGAEPDAWPEGKSPRVLTTFPPLYSFALNVAGDEAAVKCLLSIEGPHGYQYNAQDIARLRHADLFLANGLKLDDHFADRMVRGRGESSLIYVKLGDGLDKARLEKIHADSGHICPHHPPGSTDPHVWLGIPESIEMVAGLRDAFKQVDPAHAADYDRRAAAYVDRLKQLQAEGRRKLASQKVRLVSVHESLAYFARSFDLEIVGSIQQAAGDEPTGPRMRDLAKLCIDKQVRIIAIEPQYPDATARTLLNVLKDKKVTNVRLVTIDPLETANPADLDAGWYERKMAENIDNLAEALK